MRILVAALPAMAVLAPIASPLPAAASEAIDVFAEVCNANPDFFSFAVDGLKTNPSRLAGLCTCLVTEFAPLSAADLAMLTRDVDGSATADDRKAYGDYTGLELKARAALDRCLTQDGMAGPVDVPASGPADMTAFDAACAASELLLSVLGGNTAEVRGLRTTLCTCLSTTLAPQISTADAGILSEDVADTATEARRNAYPGYRQLAETAGLAYEGCFATLHPAQ